MTMERRKENKENLVSEDETEEQPVKKAKVGHKGLIKPVFLPPKVAKKKIEPFKPRKPNSTTCKPFSFVERAANQKKEKQRNESGSSEITFGGNRREIFRPPAQKARRTISMARLNQLAQPRKRNVKSDSAVSEANIFKPKSVEQVQRMLHRQPKMLQKSAKMTTVPVTVQSNLEKRAAERRALKEKQKSLEQAKLEEEKRELEKNKEKEADDLKKHRQGLGHKPAPIRKYKAVEQLMKKPVTKAVTPNFRTAKRKRQNLEN